MMRCRYSGRVVKRSPSHCAAPSLSQGDFDGLAERFDLGRYGTVCDVGGATGRLCMTLAGRYPLLEEDPTATRLPDALHDHRCWHVRKLHKKRADFRLECIDGPTLAAAQDI